jgi:uncharacterized membrane protein YfcA|tara:strand:- start:60 stop:431 length:372 start_codon:yes stop_codon:yes gene_type:complete
MNYWVGLTIVGVISGLAAGVFGAGAEILIVPLLTMLQLLPDLKNRIGTSLFMLLPPIGVFAAMKFYRKGHVDIKAALYLGLLFTIFASVSSVFTIAISDDILRKLFGIFTVLSGLYIFFNKEV